MEALQRARASHPDCEIIVIDNASIDNTVGVVRNFFSAVEIFANPGNPGFAAAVNQGAAISNGRMLLLLNPDTIVHEDFFSTLDAFIERTPQAGIIGCNMLDHLGSHQPSCWKNASIWTALLEAVLPYNLSSRLVTDNPVQASEVDMVSGGCMCIRKEIFEALKGFDERFFMYYEDSDFCLRAKESGCKIFFLPDPRVRRSRARANSPGSTPEWPLRPWSGTKRAI